MLLTELQAVMAESGIRCIVAGRQRLVLRYSEQPPHAPSGPVDPALHVLSPSVNVVVGNVRNLYAAFFLGEVEQITGPIGLAVMARRGRQEEIERLLTERGADILGIWSSSRQP